MHTEDDTFDFLRRKPFNEMLEIVEKTAVVDRTPEFYKTHGWTYHEFREERKFKWLYGNN